MDILGLYISFIGTLIVAFGSYNTVLQEIHMSIPKYGYNLAIAKKGGKQRVSTLVGFTIYSFGTLLLILGITLYREIIIQNIYFYLTFSIGVIFFIFHFYYLVPKAEKKSILATLYFYYFTNKEYAIGNWNSDNNVPNWRKNILKELGINEDISKEEFEEKIKSVRI